MPAAVRVQLLDPADARAWAAFVAEERARTYAHLVHPGFLDEQRARLDEEVAEIAAGAADGTAVHAIAWHDGVVVGAAATAASPMPWETVLDVERAPARTALDALYVAPAWHGTGLADRLLDAVVPSGALVLWLISSNDRARRFYERRGFALWGEEVSTGETWNHIPMRRMLRDGARAGTA